MHPCRQFPGHFVVHMPSCSLSCFVSRIFCLVMGGMRDPQPLTGQGGGGVAAFQVVWKKTVTVHQALQLYGQRVPVEYGGSLVYVCKRHHSRFLAVR